MTKRAPRRKTPRDDGPEPPGKAATPNDKAGWKILSCPGRPVLRAIHRIFQVAMEDPKPRALELYVGHSTRECAYTIGKSGRLRNRARGKNPPEPRQADLYAQNIRFW